MTVLSPNGFWSYARLDEQTSQDGRLTELHRLLTNALQSKVTRETVRIFKDTSDIPSGAAWESMIKGEVEGANFLIPILTQSFMASEWCMNEVRLFLETEKKRGRTNLIFPIVYHAFTDPKDYARPSAAGAQAVLDILRKRQSADFTKFRLSGFGSPEARTAIDDLARDIDKALLGQGVPRPEEPPPKQPLVTPVEVPLPPPIAEPPAQTAKPNRWEALRLLAIGGVLGLASWAAWTAAHPTDLSGETKAAVEQAVKAAEDRFGTVRATLVGERDDARSKERDVRTTLGTTRDALKKAEDDLKALVAQQPAIVARADKAEQDRREAESALAAAKAEVSAKSAELTKQRELARVDAETAGKALFAAQEQLKAASAKAENAARDLQTAKTDLAASENQRRALEAQIKAPPQAADPAKPVQDAKCPNCPDMVAIPEGSFLMGSSPAEDEREKVPEPYRGWTKPQHTVKIRAFELAKTTVTRGQFAAFVKATGERPAGDGCYNYQQQADKTWAYKKDAKADWRHPGFEQTDNDPVVCVTHGDALAYIAWLNKQVPGRPYRLPTEAEWEYAARGKAHKNDARFWGNDRASACKYANVADTTFREKWNEAADPERFFSCLDSDRFAFTAPVGSFAPNDYGLYDMLGNVWQWMADCWSADYKTAPADGTANTTGDCTLRVVRGASWDSNPWLVRSASRGRLNGRNSVTGFRLARTL